MSTTRDERCSLCRQNHDQALNSVTRDHPVFASNRDRSSPFPGKICPGESWRAGTLLLARSSRAQCRNKRDCNNKPVRPEVTRARPEESVLLPMSAPAREGRTRHEHSRNGWFGFTAQNRRLSRRASSQFCFRRRMSTLIRRISSRSSLLGIELVQLLRVRRRASRVQSNLPRCGLFVRRSSFVRNHHSRRNDQTK